MYNAIDDMYGKQEELESNVNSAVNSGSSVGPANNETGQSRIRSSGIESEDNISSSGTQGGGVGGGGGGSAPPGGVAGQNRINASEWNTHILPSLNDESINVHSTLGLGELAQLTVNDEEEGTYDVSKFFPFPVFFFTTVLLELVSEVEVELN